MTSILLFVQQRTLWMNEVAGSSGSDVDDRESQILTNAGEAT